MRILVNPRKSMQRLGFLKHLVWKASLATINNLNNLGKDLVNTVSQKTEVIVTDNIKEYITLALSNKVYSNLRNEINENNYTANNKKIMLEIQDFYLADPTLPSRRGKLVGDDWKRYPYLALELNMLKKGSYSLKTRGKTFLFLTSDDEKNAFKKVKNDRMLNSTNPLQISLSQKMLLLFSFIEADGDILLPLYKEVLEIHGSFTDKEIGNICPELYRSIAKEYRKKARSGDDLLRIQKLIATADKIEAIKNHPSPGGKNAREHAIAVRLEPFVDLEILSKTDPYAYRYNITTATMFFSYAVNTNNIQDFIDNYFFKSFNIAYHLNKVHKSDDDFIWPYILRAYLILKNPLGYVAIPDLCLLGCIYVICETEQYFEINDAVRMIMKMQNKYPKIVAFNVNKWGKINFVKFSSDAKSLITP